MFGIIARRDAPHFLRWAGTTAARRRRQAEFYRRSERPAIEPSQNRSSGLVAPGPELAGVRRARGSVETVAGRDTAGGTEAVWSEGVVAAAFALAVVVAGSGLAAGATAAGAASAAGLAGAAGATAGESAEAGLADGGDSASG